MDRTTTSLKMPLALWLLAVSCLVSQVGAQVDSLFQGFERAEEYVLQVNGETDKKAEIYFQQKIPAYLVLSSLVDPVMLVPRTKSVQGVHVMKVSRQSDGSVDLMNDAIIGIKGQFSLDGTSIVYALDGTDFVLRDKPPLLGLHRATGLAEYSSSYARLASAHAVSADAIGALRGETRNVQVRVYFGSWCPFCQQYVPRMMRVAEEIRGSKLSIDFYGLPRQISSDPVANQMNIRSVPTGVVFVDGREAGRIRQDDWRAPEKALRRILDR